MSKVLKLIYIIIIIILLLTINYTKGTKINQTIEDSSDQQAETVSTAENLLQSYTSEVYVDTDQDGMFDSYGDEEYSLADSQEKFGLNYQLEIYDSNNNGTLDVGETTPAKLTISNSSEIDYIIQNLRIDAKADFFAKDVFTNIQAPNFANNIFSFTDNLLTYDTQLAVVLNSGESLNFTWDITWNDDGSGMLEQALTDLTPYDFINIEFIATEDEGIALYYTSGKQSF